MAATRMRRLEIPEVDRYRRTLQHPFASRRLLSAARLASCLAMFSGESAAPQEHLVELIGPDSGNVAWTLCDYEEEQTLLSL